MIISSEREVRLMREVYEVTQYVKVNGEKDWHCITFWRDLRYGEIPQTEEQTITDFEEARKILGADITFFGNKPLLSINNYYDNLSGGALTLKEKQFECVEIKTEYAPYSTTIERLANMLKSDDFLEYLKDRGFTHCPLKNL